MMELRVQNDIKNINWERVPQILKEVGMAFHPVEKHRRVFAKSHSVVFIFDSDVLIGFGRAISDGECQAAIYDVAVLPAYQGKGIGRMIVQNLVQQTPECNFILYASPGKEKFYEKESFRKMKTGMALFVDGERMKERGFTE
jgi:ribosomal protein S18 acetylase RimI-like enzyme